MAEITPDLLEEFQKPAELAFEGRLIQPQAPPEPVFIDRQGFFGNVPDIARRSSVASFLQWQKDNFYHGDDPNFDLKTYLDQNPDRQPYAHIFSDAKSQGFADDRWSRFKLNLEIDQRIADSEAFWSRLVTDIATDPLNLLPAAGLRRGVGIIEGVIRGAGASLPASAVDAAIRMKYDPNASFDDVKEQFLYTTAIMGVLGGGIGMLKPGRNVNGLAKDLIDESRRLAGDAPVGYKPKNPSDESPVVLHTVPHDATGSYRPFEAQSTGDTPVGFASAYGLEKIAGQQSAFARLANAGYRATEDLANRLAGDYGVRFARAERFETPEPSASLAATKWSAEAGDAISKIRNAHARYLTGGTDSLEVAGINVRSTLAGVGDTFRGVFDRKRPDEKLTFQDFKQEIFKAHRADRIEHPIPEVEEAAKAIRPFFDNILQAQLKSGYIRNPEAATKQRGRLTAEIAEIRQQIQELQSSKSRSVNQEALLIKLNDHIKLVENELNEVSGLLNTWKQNKDIPDGGFEAYKGPEKYYLPRIFLPEQVSSKADIVRKTMTDWYSNPENYPDGIVPKRAEIVDRVASEMNGMMKLGTMPGPSSNRPYFTRSRSIDIPNEVFADIGVIDLDISNVMQYYARRAGMGLEYSRAFGSPDANLSISRTMLRVAEESKAGTVDDIFKEIENLKGEAENIRDIQLGTIFAENADSIGRRASSLIRSWFAVTSMGGALMNSLMEMVRPAMVLGIRNNFDFALKALGNVESLKKMSDEQRTKLTAVHELAAGQTFRRFFDNGIDAGVAISRTSKMLEKVEGPLAYLARTPLYLLNGVGALTHYQKQFTGFLGSDMFAQRIMRVADNTASKDDALFLVDYGISLDDARKMATMPIEKDKGIMFANTAAWSDKDLADKFYQAVQALQDRVITTPSTADKPSVMMGIIGRGATRKEAAMLGVPFQLKSWGFAANNKILLSGLQGRDASLMSGVLMLFGAGYLVSSLKTPEARWGNMSADEQILMGIEASGVLGLYGDLNFMIEQMSQDSIGLRPLMSMDPKRGKSDQYDALGEVFGPGPSKMLDIYKSFSSPYATSRDRANSVIRSLPFNNLIWIPQSFRALGRDTIESVL